MALQQGQCLGQQAAAMAEEQPGLLGCWGDGEGPQLGHGAGRLDHRGLPSSAPARGRGAFVRGFRDLLLSSQNSSGFSTLQVPAKRVGDIKETCGPMEGQDLRGGGCPVVGPWVTGELSARKVRAAALPCPRLHHKETGANPTKWDEINKATELF